MEASRGQKTGKSRRCVGRGSHAGQQEGQPSVGAAAAPTSRLRNNTPAGTTKRRGPPAVDSGPHLGAVTASEVHTDSNHSTTMARSLGSSMARGLGILLIMMTLSEIAATRARPVYNTNSSPIPMERRHRARRPPFEPRAGRRRRAAATPGTSGGSAAAAILEMRPRTSHETRRLRVQRGRLDLLYCRGRHLCVLRGLWDWRQ